MRLFAAIELDDKMRRMLVNVQEGMKKSGVEGRFVPPENLHLTLAFIGEYPDADAVLDVMDTIPFEPFTIRVDGFGCFDEVIWWAGIEKCEPLEAYVRRLRHALAGAGIPFDRKAFRPHITLVRDAVYADAPVFGEINAEMEVTFLSLMRSDQGKHEMIYTPVGVVDAC